MEVLEKWLLVRGVWGSLGESEGKRRHTEFLCSHGRYVMRIDVVIRESLGSIFLRRLSIVNNYESG